VAAEKNELVQVGDYKIFTKNEAFDKAMQINLGNRKLTEADLEKISVPTGTTVVWTRRGLGKKIIEEALEVVIIHANESRSYYSSPYEQSGGGERPDCYSDDLITGKGTPGGECATCELAEYESATQGLGQACRHIKKLFVIFKDGPMPKIIQIPPTSLRGVDDYFMDLGSSGVPFYCVESVLTLQKAKSSVVIDIEMKRHLDEPAQEHAEKYRDELLKSLHGDY